MAELDDEDALTTPENTGGENASAVNNTEDDEATFSSTSETATDASSDNAQLEFSAGHNPSASDNSIVTKSARFGLERIALRTALYFLYDSADADWKDVCRIAKVALESVIDEWIPPCPKKDVSFLRNCAEYLFPCAFSSLMWLTLREKCKSNAKRTYAFQKGATTPFLSRAAWTTAHRATRQALIHRFFFRIGTLEYSFASIVGIICCFFREELFSEIFRLRRWPQHFSLPQGFGAVLRSIIYAAVFAVPLQKVMSFATPILKESSRRRGNVKRMLFAVCVLQVKYALALARRVASFYPQMRS